MIRSTLFLVIAAAVLGAGGWFYYEHQQLVTAPAAIPSQPPVVVVQPTQADESLNRRRQEGIGSIRDLKPVHIDPAAPSKGQQK